MALAGAQAEHRGRGGNVAAGRGPPDHIAQASGHRGSSPAGAAVGRAGDPPPRSADGRGAAPRGRGEGTQGAAGSEKQLQGRGHGRPIPDPTPVADTSGGIADDVQGKQKRKRKDKEKLECTICTEDTTQISVRNSAGQNRRWLSAVLQRMVWASFRFRL
jgi:hypothetical protein